VDKSTLREKIKVYENEKTIYGRLTIYL